MELNSEKIRSIRTDKGWTQQQLADICSLSLRTIQRVELKGIGSLETSKSLAAAFEVDRNALLNTAISMTADNQAVVKLPIHFLLTGFLLGLFVGALSLWFIL